MWNYEGLSGITREINDLHTTKTTRSGVIVDVTGTEVLFPTGTFIVSHVALSSSPSLELLYPMRKKFAKEL